MTEQIKVRSETERGLIAIMALLVGVSMTWGWCWLLALAWGWFAVPLGAPTLSKAHVLGLLTLKLALLSKRDTRLLTSDENAQDTINTTAYSLALFAVVLLGAFVAHSIGI